MNQELLQAAITFFKEQHGTYESMKAQMTQGGIPLAEINQVYEEIKRLNLDPSLPGYAGTKQPLPQVTSSGYKPMNPQTPSAPTAPIATPQASAAQPAAALGVATPAAQTPINTATITPPAAPIIQPVTQQAAPSVSQTQTTPTAPPQQKDLTPANQPPVQIPAYLAQQGAVLTPPVAAPVAEIKKPNKALGVLVFTFMFIIFGFIGVIAYAAYSPNSGASLIVGSGAEALGVSQETVTSIESLFPFYTPAAQPPVEPIVTQVAATSTAENTPLAEQSQQQATNTLSLVATVPTNPQPEPVVNTPVDTDLTDEARAKDQKIIQDIQTKCLVRYGNIQACFDGNAYVVRRIISDYKSIMTKSTTERASYLGDIANKAVSGSDSLSVTFSVESGASLSGKQSLIELNLANTPVTCTDKKTGKQSQFSATSDEIRFCSPKPETLLNISCGTLSTTLAICTKGLKTYGPYSSNDDQIVKDLLAKYTSALFSGSH